jgi:phospholipid/cholesterol/gamma-HCH transport system permease protein
MTMPTIEDSATASANADAGSRRIAVRGDMTMASIGDIVGPLRAIEPAGNALSIDLAGIEKMDTAGAWIVHRLVTSWSAAGVPAHVENASAEAERLIAAAAANDADIRRRIPRGNVIIDRLNRIGAAIVGAADNLGAFLAFIGQTLIVLYQTAFGGRKLRWNAFIHQCEAIGVSALGIVGLLLFLVGMVVAQQGAVQLRQFGADVFVVNLVGRSVARELGVLLTAIMVAGRSASAFAAQIGSMKLNQEVDALETIGLSPIEVLVVPRVTAMALMLTLLGFYGIVMAILGGGLFAWVSLDIPPSSFFRRIQEVTPLSDLVIGVVKAPVFGLVIAMMGCFQGLQVTGNAESVGERTTRAVVESIFAVIVLDAFFAVFFSALGYN